MPNTPTFQYQLKTEPVQAQPPERLGWQARWVDPQRNWKVKTAAAAMVAMVAGPIGPPPLPNVADIDSFFRSLIQPITNQAKRRDWQQRLSSLAGPISPPPLPNVADIDSFFRSLIQPLRNQAAVRDWRQRLAGLDFVADIVNPGAATINVDGWYQPFSQPDRTVKRGAQLKEEFFGTPADIGQPGDGIIANVTTGQVFARSLLYQSTPYTPFVETTETITVDKWFANFREPVREKPGIKAHNQQFLAFVKAGPFPETVSIDRWLQPLSGPVRVKPRATEFAPASVLGAPPTVASVSGWWKDLSTPPKAKARSAEYPAFFMGWLAVPSAEVVTVDKWYEPLSELKVKTKARAAEYPAFTYGAVPIPAITGLLTSPDQSVTFTRTRLYQSITTTPPPERITPDKWYQQLSEPKRFKAGLRTGQQQALAYTTFIPTPSMATWYANLSQPYLKKAIKPQYQPYFSWSSFTPAAQTITLDMWYSPFSKPYLKRSFGAHEQKFAAWSQIDFSTSRGTTAKGYILI